MKRWLPLVVASSIAGWGCQPGGSRNPADLADVDPPPPPQTISRFNVPIEYDFTPLMATVERIVPKTFGSLDDVRQLGNDPHRHYAFVATRLPFTAFIAGSQVHLRTTLAYEARGYFKPVVGPTVSAGCGTTTQRPRLVVELVTPLTLDSSWHLKSKARIAGVERATKTPQDQCRVSVLHLDVTDQIVEAARKGLETHLRQVDANIAAVSLRDYAVDWWAALNRPIRLRDGIWLELQPARLRLGQITGTKHTLTIRAGVDAFPRIVSGAEPAMVSSPLPKLAGSPNAEGFDIVIDGNIDYPTVSKALNDVLRGKTVSTGGRTVVIDSLAASGGTGGHLELALMFSGDSKGTLLLHGTPTFARAAGEIQMADLDYDLSTDNKLVDAIAWVQSDTLRAMLRDRVRIPIAPVLDRGRQILTAGLNRTIGTTIALSATVDSVAVKDLYVRRPGIIVRAAARGRAKVAVLKAKK